MAPRTTLPDIPPPPRPLFWVALMWLAGLSGGVNLPLPAWLSLGAAVALTASAAWFLFKARRIRGGRVPPGWLLLGALACLAWHEGGGLAHKDKQAAAEIAVLPPAGEYADVTGTVDEEPEYGEAGYRLTLANVQIMPRTPGAAPLRLSERMTLTLRDEANAALLRAGLPLPGQTLRATGTVYPLLGNTSPSSFNAAAYQRSTQLQARMTFVHAADLQLGPPPQSFNADFLALMRSAREGIGTLLECELPHPQANLARAFFLGEAERLELADRDAFRVTGLSHLMAVSGFNVALVLIVIMVLARAAGAPPRLGSGIGIAAIITFSALTGFEAPVMRAAFMGVFVLLGMVLGRPGNTLSGLSLAVFLSLLFDPRNILRIDWQLSYACVFSLLLFTRPLLNLFGANADVDAVTRAQPSFWSRNFKQYVGLPLATTFAVQLGLFPLQIYYFRQINLLFPLANLVGIALGSVAMVLLTVLILAGWIPGIITIAAWGTSITLEVLMEFIRWLQGIQWVQMILPPLPLVWMLLFMLILLSGAWLLAAPHAWPRQRRSLIITLATLGIIIAWAPLLGSAGHARGAFDLYILDVGQGDAIVLRAPNGHILTVDAGRNLPDEGRLVVGPFLQALGILHIDTVLATHADADHIGGIPWLLKHFSVGEIVVGSATSASTVYAQMRALEIERHIPVYQVEWGAKLEGYGPLSIQCLGSVPNMHDNDASIVLLLSLGKTQALLTGDLAKAGEDAILQMYKLPPVEVLKVGHHGSKSSSSAEWLDALQPRLALVSVGAHNRYGHPAPEVMQRLTEHHAATYRTDQLGTLWLHADGAHATLYQFAGQ